MDNKALIIFLVVGLIAGFLASLIVGGGGILRYLISGVLGSFVGGYLLNAAGINLGISNKLAFADRHINDWRDCRGAARAFDQLIVSGTLKQNGPHPWNRYNPICP